MSKNKSTQYSSLNLKGLLSTPHPSLQTASPGPLNGAVNLDPITRTRITVNLDQIQAYHLNPRRSRNPEYDSIKESIRFRGLDNPPSVTRRPGDSSYTIKNGGNTRLQILKELYSETGDRRFYEWEADFIPWVSDVDAITGHLIENDARGEMVFIDRALAVRELQRLWESESGAALSQRDLASRLNGLGYSISPALINRIAFTVDHLYPSIPRVLSNGLGKHQIERLIKLRSVCEKIWLHFSEESPQEYEAAFSAALSLCDQYADSEWNYDAAEADITKELALNLGISILEMQIALDRALNNQPIAQQDAPNISSGENINSMEGADFSRNNTSVVPPNADSVGVDTNAPKISEHRDSTARRTDIAVSSDLNSVKDVCASTTRRIKESQQLWSRLLSDNPKLVAEYLQSCAMDLSGLVGLPQDIFQPTEDGAGFEILIPSYETASEWNAAQRSIFWLLQDCLYPHISPTEREKISEIVKPESPLLAIFSEASALGSVSVDGSLVTGAVVDLLLGMQQVQKKIGR